MLHCHTEYVTIIKENPQIFFIAFLAFEAYNDRQTTRHVYRLVAHMSYVSSLEHFQSIFKAVLIGGICFVCITESRVAPFKYSCVMHLFILINSSEAIV